MTHLNKLNNKQKFNFEAIGTIWEIEGVISAQFRRRILSRIQVFDQQYSRFIEGSLVRQMAVKTGRYTLPRDAKVLFDFYQQLYEITHGLVTPLIGTTMEQAGYDHQYSLQPSKLMPPPSWGAAIEYRFPSLFIKQPCLLDFGAAGKGYLVDIIKELLLSWGVDEFCINAGGDLYVQGGVQDIGLEDPDDTSRVLGLVGITNGALCGSSPNRRKWGEFHHIIHPAILRSPGHISAIWVKAKTTMLADGISTALFFVHPVVLRREFDFEYLIIEGDTISMSDNFKATFFTKQHDETCR